ncbi:MAG: C39 family peptidase [Clostridia bacterium]
MDKNKKRSIIVIIVAVLVGLLSGLGFYNINKDKSTEEVIQGVVNEIKDYISTYEMSEQDIEKLSSTEIIEQSEEDEKSQEQEVENEEFEEQGEIAYEGSNEYPQVSLGNYTGLTYYSQIDARWKNYMYSSVGDSFQTVGTSGCGPTSAAMVVTAIKGTITPPEMADLFVNNGYRSASNGTYLSAFRWVADVFDIGYQETYNLDTAVNLLKDNNYLIVSVGNGLFTTGGHLMVITGIDGDTLKIYDPYLYSGKFDTSTRRGKVTVSGNTVYCSVDNFRRYANYTRFFAYKHDGNVQENNSNVTTSTYTRYVKTNSGAGVNVRSGAGTGYSKVGALSDGTSVTVYETSGNWSRIGTNRWVSSDYLVSTYTSSNVSNTVGETRKTKRCYLYSNSNLTGKVYTYLANTTVTILQNVSFNVDKVRVNLTGREAYINTSNYISSTSTNIKNTVGQYKRLANRTYLYQKSNLTGKVYTYLPLTQIKIIKNVSNTVDYVYVVKTGRYAYVRNKVYK